MLASLGSEAGWLWDKLQAGLTYWLFWIGLAAAVAPLIPWRKGWAAVSSRVRKIDLPSFVDDPVEAAKAQVKLIEEKKAELATLEKRRLEAIAVLQGGGA